MMIRKPFCGREPPLDSMARLGVSATPAPTQTSADTAGVPIANSESAGFSDARGDGEA